MDVGGGQQVLGAKGGPEGGESINDIQNYLASFNKEIQDGTQSTLHEVTGNGGTATVTTAAGETYYVTEATAEQVAGYQVTTFENGTEGFVSQAGGGASYYHAGPAGGTTQYYATSAGGETGGTQYAFQAVTPAATQTTVAAAGSTAVAGAVADGAKRGQRAAGGAGARRAAGQSEAREISVTIPAALAGQSGAEELLQAVEAQGSGKQEPGTFVAMQPSSAGARGQTQTIRMVVQQPDGSERQQELEVPVSESGDGSKEGLSQGTLEMMASLAERASVAEIVSASEVEEGGDAGGQVLINSGNTYQTVTIVPSDSSPGEVSYVLIVSQPDDEDKDDDDGKGVEGDVDMSIYDFNDGDQQGHASEDAGGVDGMDGDDGEGGGGGGGGRTTSSKMPRMFRLSTKKSQSVSQAHMCNYCNYTSPKRYLLSRHMKSHSEERPHKCSVCERGFKTLASLQNHVNTHTGTRPHQCKECDSAFTTSGELVRHVRYKHTHEKPHRCTDCDYASVELSKLKRHMRCHTGERPYQCPHCTYASPDTYKLKRHLRIHTGEKPYECDICRARFTQSNSLKAHKLIHTGNKPIFQCELCPTTCGRKTDLRIHVQKLHTSEKPLKCRRCGKSFPDRYSYKVHAKTHEGEKCFKCDLCPYASISQRHLESHMLIHTDQKPYQCDQCEQAFRQKQLLKRHKNLYHDPNYIAPTPKEKTHECPECGRAFRHKGNLIRHMAIHDPEATAQEKEAAMQVLTRRLKKRINEDGVEEEYSEEEEEDDFDDEDDLDDDDLDDEDDEDDNEISVGRQITTADGQQVVVLEVIQLQGPEGEQQMAVLAGESMEMVDETGQVTGTATVVNADGEAIEGGHIMLDSAGAVLTHATPIKRKPGRPPKVIKMEPASNAADESLQEDMIQGELVLTSMRPARGRRRKAEDDESFVYAATSAKQKRRGGGAAGPGRGRKQKFGGEEATDEVDEPVPTEEELARRHAESEKRRIEEKQKDLEDCFGFKDEDDEDEEDMNTSHVDTSATESAICMLAAMTD